jgi:hypothetical protein
MNNKQPPDLSHLNLRTQVVEVLYAMDCDAELLDAVEIYAEASSNEIDFSLLDLDSSTEEVETAHPLLSEIIAATKKAGIKTIVFTG